MTEQVLVTSLMFGAILFASGLLLVVARRNLIVIFLGIELMLQGVSVTAVAFSKLHHNQAGNLLALFSLAIAAADAGIGLAVFVRLYRSASTLDVLAWSCLNETPVAGDGAQPKFATGDIIQESAAFPCLVPAGKRPLKLPENLGV